MIPLGGIEMILQTSITTDFVIHSLKDLVKLKPFLEAGSLKINKSQLARELGKDRRTIDKYINGYEKPKTRNRSSFIDHYYDIIKELLSKESQQIFYYKRVLWQYLKDNHGLTCAQSSFRRYISKHPEFDEYFKKHSKSFISKKTHLRFETDAGQQAQIDWKESVEYTLKDGETISINIFVYLLAFSRFRVYRLSLSKNQDILFSFLDDAFELCGGVPAELLTDNMKTVMDNPRTEYSKGKVNNKFQQFADDYGFKVKPCIAGRPQTKAKVEAPMKLLDEILAYNGQLDYAELNELIIRLNNRINHSVHAGTGKIPVMYLEKEKTSLSPLPKEQIRKSYQINTLSSKVNSSSMITYQSNQYSVPPEYIGKRMTLQVYDHHIYVYYNTKLVTVHPISQMKLNYQEQHYLKVSKITLKNDFSKIEEMAKNNLKLIGKVYKHE